MMWTIRKLIILALAAVILMSATACQRNNNDAANNAGTPQASPTVSPTGTPAETASPSPTDAGTTVNAEAVYKSRCIACHAADLSGGMGPGLQDVGARMSVEEIADRIENGGNGMMAYKGVLTDEEIQGLVDWLAAKKG